MSPKLPGAVLGPLRERLRDEPNVVRAWWTDDSRLLVAVDDVGGAPHVYREYVQRLAAAVLPLLAPYGASFGCGPMDGITPSARRGIVVYERAGG